MEIELHGEKFEVDFDFNEGEPEVRWLSNGDPGHPGTDDEVVINKVEFEGNDITKVIEAFDLWNEFESVILAKYE